MTICVNTQEYKAVHHKQPRGFGSWVFYFEQNAPLRGYFVAPFGNYSAAKKVALKEAKRIAASTVYVAS